MNISYIDIALDSFLAQLVFAFTSEALLYGMAAFGTEQLPLAIAVAWIASMAAYAVNFAIGKAMDRMRIDTGKQQYEKAQRFFQRWLVWGLLLAGQPFVGALMLAAGIFAVSWQRAILLAAIGHALRYGWLLFG